MLEVQSIAKRFAITVKPGESSGSHEFNLTAPAGRWRKGNWQVEGVVPSGTPFLEKTIGEDILEYAPGVGGERYTLTSAVGELTLRTIEAADGQATRITMTDRFAEELREGAVGHVTSLAISLEGYTTIRPDDGVGRVWKTYYYATEAERPKALRSPGD